MAEPSMGLAAINDDVPPGHCVMVDDETEIVLYAGPIYTAPFLPKAILYLCAQDHAKLIAIMQRRVH